MKKAIMFLFLLCVSSSLFSCDNGRSNKDSNEVSIEQEEIAETSFSFEADSNTENIRNEQTTKVKTENEISVDSEEVTEKKTGSFNSKTDDSAKDYKSEENELPIISDDISKSVDSEPENESVIENIENRDETSVSDNVIELPFIPIEDLQ